jgi:hypothetical protein
MWESSWALHHDFGFVKTTFRMKLGLHGFGDGIYGFVMGIHTHRKV